MNGHRTRSPGAATCGNQIAVALHHANPVCWNPGLIRQKLGIDRFMALTIGLCSDKNCHRRILIKSYIRAFFRIAENTFNIVTQSLPTQLTCRSTKRSALPKTGFIRGLFNTAQQPVKIANVISFAADRSVGKRR